MQVRRSSLYRPTIIEYGYNIMAQTENDQSEETKINVGSKTKLESHCYYVDVDNKLGI